MPRSPISSWSTTDVDPSQRLEYYSSALSSAVTPMKADTPRIEPETFRVDMRSASLGPINVINQSGSAHRVNRGPSQISASGEHSYHLILNTGATWELTHRGRVLVNPGDIILTDSQYGSSIDLRSDFGAVHLRLSEDWMRRWVASPGVLVGRNIPNTSRWFQALSSFVAQLSAEFVVGCPLPHSIVVDQIGSLLALVAGELQGGIAKPTSPVVGMRDRIQERIIQRCPESTIDAAEIARSLNISTRTLHRHLAASGQTFGASLQKARVEIAARMLESALFRKLTTAEIGRRVGFTDASHFARVFKHATGGTPASLRSG